MFVFRILHILLLYTERKLCCLIKRRDKCQIFSVLNQASCHEIIWGEGVKVLLYALLIPASNTGERSAS
jgi:hypothetical protein